MPGWHTALLFMLAALALNVSPGPSILYILSRCAGQGRRAGIVSVFGLATAALVHAMAVALGASALILDAPIGFTVLKYAGALYLVYLGLRTLIAGPPQLERTAISEAAPSLWRVYGQGIVTDLLNPKVATFFVAFLPQFTDPSLGSAGTQILVLGILFNVTSIPVNLAVAFAGGSLLAFLAGRPVWARVQAWCSSAVLIGLGLRLALSERP